MNSNDVLEDFSSQKFKSRFHATLLILLCFYFVYILFDLFFDKERLQIKTGSWDWPLLALLFLLPLTGSFFFVLRKKAGWVINSIYFWFLALSLVASFIKGIIDKTFHFNWYGFFVLIISLVISIMMIIKETRKHFSIGNRMFITCLLLAVLISCIFIAIVFSQ